MSLHWFDGHPILCVLFFIQMYFLCLLLMIWIVSSAPIAGFLGGSTDAGIPMDRPMKPADETNFK